MALRGNTTEEKIWNYAKDKGLTDCGAAGLMGNLFAESGLKPTNLQNTYEKKLGFTDETYTAEVDAGTYGNFVNDAAGAMDIPHPESRAVRVHARRRKVNRRLGSAAGLSFQGITGIYSGMVRIAGGC